MFRALQFRNFRWFLLSQGCSMTGSWVQQVALGWLVYRMTGSAFDLGLVGGVGMVPSFCLAPIAGVVADRFDRRKIVLIIQGFAVVHSLVLAVLVSTETATVGALIALSLSMGVVQGFDWPTRQSLVVHLVEGRTHLGNAIALNSTVFNLARVAGPSIAGVLLSAGGDALCFSLSGAAAGLALVSMSRVRISRSAARPVRGDFVQEFLEGAAYTWREPVMRRGLAMVALASGCIMPYVALLPLFAAEVLGGDARLFAMLAAAPAVGAIAGGLLLAARRSPEGLPRQIFAMGVVAPLSAMVFAGSRFLPLTVAALVVLGGAMMVWMSSINTRLQMVVAEQKRGRVMSFFIMALMGAMPAGYFVMGMVADQAGPAFTVMAGAVVCCGGNLWLHRSGLAHRAVSLARQLA